MKKLLYMFVLLFFTHLNAEIVNVLDVKGNKRVSKETIKLYGNINLGSDYSINDLDKILKNLYETEFFEDIKIEIKNNILIINVKEYPIINEIIIEGEKAKKIQEDIKKRLQLKEKESFIKSKLNDDVNKIKKAYGTLGFIFTEVDTIVEEFSENRINLTYKIIKNKKTKISKINFIGDKKVKEKRLRDIIASEEDAFWKFITKNTVLSDERSELDKRLLKNYYKSIGYYDVQIVSSNAEINENNETVLTYNINAGNRYRIKKITTNIDQVFDKEVFFPLNEKYKKIIGKYYSPFSVKKLLDDVDELIDANDLQFVEHSVNEIIEGESIEIKINIFEGSKELVERITIEGNSVTNEAIIRGELLLDEGDPFNKLKLDKSIAKLKAKGIFAKVEKEISTGNIKNTKRIKIKVEEKPTGEISAGAGIGTDGGSFAFNIKENNYLGEGIRLNTYIDARAESLKGAIEVTNPNYQLTGNELTFGLSSQTNDKPDSGYKNNIFATSIGTKFEQYTDVFLTPSLQLTYDDLEVQSTASDALKKQAGTSTDLAFTYGALRDKRNRTFKPTDGNVLQFSQTLPVYADGPYMRNTLLYNQYQTFGPDVVGAAKFFVSGINSLDDVEDVKLSKRLNLPSSKLRGFAFGKIGPKDGDDYIGGNYAYSLNLETNLPNLLPEATKTDVTAFFDVGNVFGVDYDSSIDDSNKIRSSTGLSANFLSPVGPMTFIFAKSLTKAETDETQGFNFRLGTTF